ncbi:MAG: tetratricopeptide repeat protein [Acidobacteriota bacterium]|nr:tetratricopeptide repeat protein [Acidobacteriota bacterium]
MKESTDSPDAHASGPLASVADAPVSADLVRRELERLLASQTFHSAKGQKRFLWFVVERTLAGCAQELKESTLGVQVFQRGSQFDPRLDTIVRVEARKLRARLTKYYETEGKLNPLRIALPSRGYVPNFRHADVSMALPEALPPSTHDEGSGPDIARSISTAVSLPAAREFSHAAPGPAAPATANFFARRWPALGLLCALLMLTGVAIYIDGGRLSRASQTSFPVAPSIAVLPFQNLGNIQDASFADGLTEDLIDSMGRVQGLQVVARTSSFQFRSKTLDIRQIGKALNVRTVLEGSVRTDGNRIRITAQLDDTSNGYRLWSNSYEGSFENALFVQRDIAQEIVAALREEFATADGAPDLKFSPRKAVPLRAEAYQDYLRGVYFWNKQTTDSVKTAIAYFEHAIAEEPDYAPSYTGLARCYMNIPSFGTTRARDVVPKIRELALKASALDSSLAEPHIDLAYVAFLKYDWEGAEAEFKKGLRLNPGDAVAHRLYSTFLSAVGRMDDALAEDKISQRLDPVSPYMLEGIARSLYRMRQYDEAIAQFRKVLALDPQFGYAHLGLGKVYIQKHQYQEALTELQLAQQLMGKQPSSAADLARIYASSGKTAEAQKILQEFLEQSRHGSFPPKPIADVYLALGDRESALEWLAKAVRARDVNLRLTTDPSYDVLRSDPRFAQLLQKANLPTRTAALGSTIAPNHSPWPN